MSNLKASLKFCNEAEEREYWESHNYSDYVDWSKAELVSMPNLKASTKTFLLRLPESPLDSIKVDAN